MDPLEQDEKDFFAQCDEISSYKLCSHRNVGALIADRNGQAIGWGRNQPDPGSNDVPICARGGCPRGLLAPGQGATDYSDCTAVHAEFMAIVSALSRHGDLRRATIYVNSAPCSMCIKMCLAVGIARVVWRDEHNEYQERNLGRFPPR